MARALVGRARRASREGRARAARSGVPAARPRGGRRRGQASEVYAAPGARRVEPEPSASTRRRGYHHGTVAAASGPARVAAVSPRTSTVRALKDRLVADAPVHPRGAPRLVDGDASPEPAKEKKRSPKENEEDEERRTRGARPARSSDVRASSRPPPELRVAPGLTRAWKAAPRSRRRAARRETG